MGIEDPDHAVFEQLRLSNTASSLRGRAGLGTDQIQSPIRDVVRVGDLRLLTSNEVAESSPRALVMSHDTQTSSGPKQ